MNSTELSRSGPSGKRSASSPCSQQIYTSKTFQLARYGARGPKLIAGILLGLAGSLYDAPKNLSISLIISRPGTIKKSSAWSKSCNNMKTYMWPGFMFSFLMGKQFLRLRVFTCTLNDLSVEGLYTKTSMPLAFPKVTEA